MRSMVFLALVLVAACSTAPIRLRGAISHPVTSDGWKLTLERFAPAPGVVPRKVPVIVCHGVLANRNYLKLNEDASLPAVLSQRGFDVWLLDLRGREDAGSPGWFFGAQTYTYTVDDYVLRDMDTAISHVLAATGASRVVWVGHSLGGIIAYARLGSYGDARVARLVTIGSPGRLAPASRNMLLAQGAAGGLALLPMLPVAPFAELAGFTGIPLTLPQIEDTIYYRPNLSDDEHSKLLRFSSNNGSKAELRQLLGGMRQNAFFSADGKVAYSANLGNIGIPVLLVAGRRDHLADPLTVRYVYDQLPGPDKTLLIAGRGTGFSEDFGHSDLVVGDKATKEVLPRITAWLEARDGR
ncbi:MAG: alpha/beta fold hydrolase [Myxococcales bacterium]